MKTLVIIAGLSTVMALPAAYAQWSATLEAGCSHNSARGETAINPAGALVKVDERFCEAAINPSFYKSGRNFELQASTWLQANDDIFAEDEHEFLISESYVNWLINDNAQLKFGWFNTEVGSGYAWNPSNPFFDIRVNERDQAIRFKREGDPGVVFSLTDAQGEWNIKALDYDANSLNDEVDLSVSVSRHQYFSNGEWSATVASLEGGLFLGANFATTIGEKLELHAEASYREQSRSLRPSAILTDVGVIESFAPQSEEGFINALLGMQYTFDNDINIIAEYFYQEEGYSSGEFDNLLNSIQRQRSQFEQGVLPAPSAGFLASTHQLLRLLRQDYLFLRASFPEWYSVSSSIFVRHNLNDSSYVSGINAQTFITDSAALNLSLQHSDGDIQTEAYWFPNKFALTVSIQFQF